MLRKVKLYGDLAKFVGERVLEADVANAAQSIRFLLANWPELEKYMADRHYKVVVNDWEVAEEELHYPTGQSDIQIIPVVGGAGGNTGRIIIGALLIGASFFFPGAGMFGANSMTWGLKAGGAGLKFATAAGTFTSAIGASMVLSGISGLLTPVPTIPENEQDPRLSFSFSGIQNTSRAGVAVPLIYGETISGSVTISAGIDTNQVEA
jgi:predicted phage tail protein